MTLAPHEFTREDYFIVEPSKMLADPANQSNWFDNHSIEGRQAIGAWRWAGIRQHRVEFLEVLHGGTVLDFGGAAGPFGYGSVIIDPIGGHTPCLYDHAGYVDGVVSSHTLEHVPDLDLLITCFAEKIVAGGRLVFLVPSWRQVNLRAENFPYHCHTFSIVGDAPDCSTVNIDTLFDEADWKLEEASHTVDFGIFLSLTRK